jgi:hypothetical protein
VVAKDPAEVTAADVFDSTPISEGIASLAPVHIPAVSKATWSMRGLYRPVVRGGTVIGDRRPAPAPFPA